MTSGGGTPAKPALWGEAGATGAVRTSGQLGPKSHSAVGDGEARSAGFGEAPQQAVFLVFGRRAKFEKRASVATLALLAV